MPVRKSSAVWKGTLKRGAGTMRIGAGAWEGPFSFMSRFESGPGTNPEELLAAAHAGCFSMALSGLLEQAGHEAAQIRTSAEVTINRKDVGFRIETVRLMTEGTVPGISESDFRRFAEQAKAGCPISAALNSSIAVSLEARLVK